MTGLAALLLFSQVHALGLGELKVSSALDEPLVAEIELTAVAGDELDSLEVQLGTREDFARADISRTEFLGQLDFQVRKTGTPAIVINTTQPAREPFLHFLVSVSWSDGKLVREYTALLDPPLYAAQQATAVSSPGVVEEAERLKAESAGGAMTSRSPADAQPALPPSSQGGVAGFSGAEYGPTVEGDTLWGIASQFDARGYDVNVFQIMIALLRENPEAFIDNNVNRLKVGQILRLSDIESVAAISKQEASFAYQAQLEEWQAYRTSVADASDVTKLPDAQPTQDVSRGAASTGSAEPEAAAAVAGMAEAGTEPAGSMAGEAETGGSAMAEQDLLKIVQATLDTEQGAAAGSSGAQLEAVKAAADSEISALRDQINTLEESLVSRELENKELRERVAMLEGQVSNAQRLVELESQELALAQQQAAEAQREAAAAQAQIAQAQEQAQQQVMQAQQQAAEAQQQTAQAQQQAEQSQQAAQQASQAASESAAAKPAEPAVAAADTAEPAASEQPKAKKTRVVAGGDDGAASAQPVSQRPPAKSWWESGLDMIPSVSVPVPTGSSMSLIAGAVGVIVLLGAVLLFVRRRRSIAEFEESILSGSGLDEQTESTETAASNKGTDTSFLSDFGMAGMGSMQADEVDPLAEAEVYLAYGRDEQAEEVLKEAASRNPNRHELKLKLLEIYQQRDDLKSFETLAEELYPAGGQGDLVTWGKVAEMGLKMNPNNPLFSRELPGGMAPPAADGEESDALLLPDMDDGGLPQEIVGRSSTPVDPGLQPFPPPDKNAGLDEEFERVASRLTEPAKAPDDDAGAAAEKADVMDQGTSNDAEFDFDLDLVEDQEPERGEERKPKPVAVRAEAEPEFELNLDLDGDEPEDQIASEDSDELDFDLDEIKLTRSDGSLAGGNGGAADKEDEGDSDTVETAQWDEAATKLDLAQAYLNMGDKAGARSIIDEVMKEGNPAQRNQAADMAAQLG